MNWDALGAIAETLGAIGVLVTVVYLSIQVRNNSKEVRENTLQSLLEKSVDILGSGINQHPALISARDKNRFEELTSEETQIFRNWIMRNFQFFELVYLQHQKGRVDNEVMSSYERRIRTFFRNNNLVVEWWDVAPHFTESFRKYVDSIKQEET